MANRSNHHGQRSIASAAPAMPLRVPAAVSALALVLALSGANVHAQGQASSRGNSADSARQAADPAPQSPPDDGKRARKNKNELQEVVVTGLRQSLMSSEAIKRLSPQVVDAVSAEDIGALPDRSVAEALQRIPGVLVERTDNNRDPARLTDSGGNVFIRGLSWVKSELDGEEIFSANSGRDISFEDISPDLLSAIKVYKSPTANQIEGGIGGVIDMETRKPLNSRHNLTAFSADYEYGDMIKKGFPTVNGLWSNYWETGIGKVGVLLSGTYAQEGNRTDSIQLGDYVGQILPQGEGGQPAGATVWVPNDMAWRRLDWKQNRQALDGVFQWQSPDDKWLLTAHAFQTKDNPQNLENTEAALGGEYLGSPANGATYGAVPSGETYTAIDNSGVVTAGTVGIEPTLDTRYEKDHHSTDMFTANLQWKPTDRVTLSNDLQYEKSHADMVSMTAFTAVGNPQTGVAGASGGIPVDTTLAFNLAGNTPSVALSQTPYSMKNPADYWWYAAMDHIEDNDAHQWADRLDGTLKFQDNDWLSALRAGARFTDRQAITRESNWNWALLSAAYYWGGAPVTLTQTPGWASSYQPFNDFMRGSIAQVAPGWFPSYQLVRNGTAYACSLLCQTEQPPGSGWKPLTTDWSKYSPGSDNPINGINDQDEHTYAGYVSADFHHHTPIGPMDGNIGVRVVRTVQAASSGTLVIPSDSGLVGTPAQCAAAASAATCAAYDNAYDFEGAGGTLPYDFPANTYTNVLPSLNVRFLLTHDLQWRFAASQSVAPPPFSDMVPFANISYTFQQNNFLPALVNAVSGASGNPLLKPTRSNDFDTSLEWYFAPAGDLTFDIFYKDIRDYILTETVYQPLTFNGVHDSFPITMYENGAHGSVKGFELSYQQFYTFLPSFLQGLGLQGNLTFVDDSGGANAAQDSFDTNQVVGAKNIALPMEGMSRWSYNAALMYQAHNIEGRLAWTWRERYLLTTSAANLNEPVWMDNYGQLDGEIFYDVTDYLKVGVQGTNLLRSRTYLDVGPGPTTPVVPRYSWTDTDRTYAIAVRLQF
ncbi:MAG: TonB-dependent receptor [Acetobacteraceae bacterium]